MAMSVLKHMKVLKCPDCNTETVIEIWSCGCQVAPDLKHCTGKTFKDQGKRCGQRGEHSRHSVIDSANKTVTGLIIEK